ncbi:MAG: asparaginase, partial [Candidatus Kaiserbacteria bacterium]|nr:asparaginase [Candidatus Kaiserbacteria bacterium]
VMKGLEERIEVVWFQVHPKAIDSTNARWHHWVTIGNAAKLLYDWVDGYVVLGGTDTMAHMLASMQFMFPNIGKPIVGGGAQLPIKRLGTDAERNLFFELVTAASDLSGAHLAFDENVRHGLHVFKVQDKKLRAYDSPQRFVIGDYDGDVNLYPSAPKRNPFVTSARLEFRPGFREGIKVVELSPATTSRSILHDASDPDCSALLLITYGAGNVRDEPGFPGEITHIDAIRQLHERRYPVILGSPMMDGKVDSPYAVGAKAVSAEVGGISGGDTCGPTLHVKAMRSLALAWNTDADALDYDRFREHMLRDHVGELTVNMSK